ncbi:MAG TPA: UPF0182 family protein [Deltaproteobacteria bacterium]|nr:UPF0182 family protein [Deltaproteobacteria bacterium]HOI07788.1 UPF0182 family protein [Deltaproteobacteria bacterium]
MKGNRLPLITVIVAIVLIASPILFSFISGILVQWLWMRELGFEVIFFRTLFLRLGLFGAAFGIVFLFSWASVAMALRMSPRHEPLHLVRPNEASIPLPRMRLMAFGLTLAFAILFALVIQNQWDTLLGFIWGEPAGQADPVYGKDLGFYLFRLPFYNLIQGSFATLFLIVLVATAIIYLSLEKIPATSYALKVMDASVLAHLSLLGVLLLLSLAAGYLLDRYGLLFSQRGVVYGMGYVDYHVVRVSLIVMAISSLVLAALVGANAVIRSMPLMTVAVGLFVLLSILSRGIVPGLVQRFVVRPNELGLEKPYLEHNIAWTRKAYLLDRVKERPYPARDTLTRANIAANRDTMQNIRLWDWRPILQTYNQTQAIRQYYQFYEVDVDRYDVPGEGYRQVMLSGRELAEELPQQARTWVNRTLQFTHGYGLAMSYVSEFVGEGLPRYVISDIPPVSPSLKVTQAAIYYGERTPGYRIVNTGISELDYPKGDTNVYTHYQGTGGIPLDGFWKKLLFAWDLRDINILISGYLTPSSRIQIWRNLGQRVSRIAPFLVLDRDPYLVLSQGRLFWIQDAYTVSARYPYSEPYDRFGRNYIRNSVKAVMDAYNGSVRFYLFDREDPLIRMYTRAFPGVFRDRDSMPASLKAHIRFPEDLFTIQVDKYRTYHMTVPQVFYNREDLWEFPRESLGGEKEGRMEPYYVLIRLPGENALQYIQMVPLTPQNRNNMIAWMASRSDEPFYGEVIVYRLPKERLFFGPVQVNATINQDTLISQQLSLWDQRGSRVIRGNLLVIPVDNAFLYVEPVYIVGEGSNIPELKRVILAHGGRVVMERTVADAVNALFGAQEAEVRAPLPPGQDIPAALRKDLMEGIQEAERSLRQGNWTAFGRAMDRLKGILSGQAGGAPAQDRAPP